MKMLTNIFNLFTVLKAEMRQIFYDAAKYFKGFPIDWQCNIITFDCMVDMPGYPKSFGHQGK